MAVEIPQGDDTEMNMTPMIDIVFQLIIFFLLSLKFKTVDMRIDTSLPKDRGLAPTQAHPPDFEKIKIKLFRKNKGNEMEAFTRIRIGNNKAHTFDMPKGPWPTTGGEADTYRKERDKRFNAIKAIVRKQFTDQGSRPEITGEIVAAPPDGGAVPHGDIIRILDIMVEVQIKQVVFEGAAPPLLRSEGGHGP